MMKTKLRTSLIIILLITMVLLTGKVNAASVSMSLGGQTTFKEGDIVVITLRISSIDAGDGVDSILATLDYDKDVFEEVTDENFEGKNKWNVNIYNTDSQQFTVSKSSKVNAAADVLTISLKVKESINKESTTVTLKEITTSGGAVDMGGTGDIQVQNTSITLKKQSTTPQPPTTTTNETSVNTTTNETKTNTVGQINLNTNTKKDTASGRIPQTGENTIGIIAGISIVAIISVVAFVKYRDLKIK